MVEKRLRTSGIKVVEHQHFYQQSLPVTALSMPAGWMETLLLSRSWTLLV